MLSQSTLNYAAPPEDYFWKWSHDFDAAEWSDGPTLAFWMELHGILKYLGEDGGLPPMGAVLLVLAACKEDWIERCIAFHEQAMAILGVKSGDEVPMEIRDIFVRGLKVVNDLPKDLRSSFGAKCLLVSALFEGGPYSEPRNHSPVILRELATHSPSVVGGEIPKLDARARFLRDFRALRSALSRYDPRHDRESLESRLRTGLESFALNPAAVPAKSSGENDTRPLLDRLIADKNEAGAAAGIAKQAIAMLNLPGAYGRPQDLPIGGISDITNRGTIDRLLPGELAWDDLMLATRLAHNEALYFRREVPPSKIAVSHTILLDRNIRLWGTARVFALGVALGLRHHPALDEDGVVFEAHAATQDGFEPLELTTPAGVQAALRPLVSLPAPIRFLKMWSEHAERNEGGEVPDLSFITATEQLDDPEVRTMLGRIAEWIHGRSGVCRVFAVGRTGDFRIQEWSPAGIREVFHGEIDLKGLFSEPEVPEKKAVPPPPLRVEKNPLREMLPIYALGRLPFLFPKIPQGSAILEAERPGDVPVMGITSERNLMHWPRIGWGGREILARIPGRQHWLGRDDHHVPVIVASGEKAGEHVRVFRVIDDRLDEIEMAASAHTFPRHATVSGGAVLLAYSDNIEALSLSDGNKLATMKVTAWPPDWKAYFDGRNIHVTSSGNDPVPALKQWPFGDPTWPRMFVPEAAGFDGECLAVVSRDLVCTFDPTRLIWRMTQRSKMTFRSAFQETEFSPAKGMNLKVARRELKWEIWFDPRGMLHVRDLTSDASASWSLILCSEATAVWNSVHGLCAMESRLREPDAGKPTPSALKDLAGFLTGLATGKRS